MLTLPVVMFVHELITFGIIWGFMSGERELPAFEYPFSVGWIATSQLIMSVLPASFLALVSLAFFQMRFCVWMLSGSYLLAYFLAVNGTANAYRHHFGNTWGFSEAFWELIFHPIMTPGLGVIGLVSFLWFSKRVWLVD